MYKTKKQKIAVNSFLALMLAEILWGANKPIIKLGLETVPLMLYLSITILGAAFLTLPFALKKWKRLSQKDYIILIVGSIISITVGNVALLMGLQRIPVVNASLISLFGPLLLFMLSVAFLKERLSLRAFVGVLVAFAGAAIIVGKPWDVSADSQDMMIGNFLIILAVLCDVIGLLICKPILKKAGTNQVTFIHLLAGILPIALFSLQDLSALSLSVAGKSGYTAMFFNIIAITLANCLFMYGLKHKKAQQVSIFGYLGPLTTLVVAWIILSELPTIATIAGGALIFIGIYLAEVKTPRKVSRRKALKFA